MMVTFLAIDDTRVTYKVDAVTGVMSLTVVAPASVGGSLHTEGSMKVKFSEWHEASWLASWLADRTAKEAAKFEAMLTSAREDVIRQAQEQDDD